MKKLMIFMLLAITFVACSKPAETPVTVVPSTVVDSTVVTVDSSVTVVK